MRRLKETRGITLVALVITVIILLILAGVTINILIGENGMIIKTKKVVEESEMASIKEQAELVKSEQVMNMFREEPQELTKGSYINALNVNFEDSIVEGSRVIVKDKKYAIFVKSNLEVEIIRNDGKILAEGEMKLDYKVTEDGVIEIYPRIGGVESYKLYAEKILEGKTQEEKERIYMDALKYYNPDEYEQAFEGIENPTFDDVLRLEGISKEEFMETLSNQGLTFDEFLIKVRAVKPEGYDFDNEKYSKIEITCPNGNKLYTDTDTLCATYKVYQKGEYKFIANVVYGDFEKLSAEIIVPVTIDIPFPELVDEEKKPELKAIKLEINVTEDNKEIQLPVYKDTYENYIYDCEVDWGDETEKQQVINSNLDNTNHTYTDIGTYTITINGTYESLYVKWNNKSMKQALIKVNQWGATGLKNVYLGDSTNLTQIASPSKNSFINMTDFKHTFERCISLKSIPEDLFANSPNVTSFYHTFYYCSNLEGQSIHLWEEGRNGINESDGGWNCYTNCKKLKDYKIIPRNWKEGNE